VDKGALQPEQQMLNQLAGTVAVKAALEMEVVTTVLVVVGPQISELL
jgi:hypothetical protein